MIKAEITLSTCYGQTVIPVEVLDLGPRPGTVWVLALDGLHPFTRISHGGPCQNSSAVIGIPRLRNVCQVPPQQEENREKEIAPIQVWFLSQVGNDLPRPQEVAVYENQLDGE